MEREGTCVGEVAWRVTAIERALAPGKAPEIRVRSVDVTPSRPPLHQKLPRRQTVQPKTGTGLREP